MANLEDLMVRVGVDTEQLESGFTSAVSTVERNIGKITAAGAIGGAAMEGFARKQGDANVAFERMGRVTGEGSGAMRDMATDLQNVTFPMEDVTSLMETATQRGLEGDAIGEYASFWDMVGDATGEAGPELGKAGTALGLVGIKAGEESEALDALGHVTDNSTGSISEFLKFTERAGRELGDSTPNVNDMAAALTALEDKGFGAQVAQRELQQALREADGDMDTALETLGLSGQAYDEMRGQVEGSGEAITANADALAESFTPMERLSSEAENLMTRYGGLADAAGSMAVPLLALGPITKGITMAISGLRSGLTFLVTGIRTAITTIWSKITALASWAGAVIAQGARAVASMVATAAKFTAQWTLMAARATVNGVKIAAVWTTQIIASAARGAAAMATSAARVVAGWVLMGAQSMLQAARMAAAWVLAMGPIGWITAAVVGLVALVVANWDKIKEWTISIWETVSQWVSDKWDEIVTWITDGVTAAADWVSDGFNNAKDWAMNIWNSVVNFIKGIPGRFMAGLAAIGNIAGRIGAWIGNARDAAVNRFMGLVNWVRGVPGRIVRALGNLGNLLLNAGWSIIQGFLNGLKQAWRNVTDFVGGIASWIADNKGPISYDRKILTPAGGAIMDGLNEGLQDEMGNLGGTLDDITWMLENGIDPEMGQIEGPSVSGIEGQISPSDSHRGDNGNQRAGSQVNVTINNPVSETTSKSTERASKHLGLGAGL